MASCRLIAESFGYTVSDIEKGSIAHVRNADAKLTDDKIYENIAQVLTERKQMAKDSRPATLTRRLTRLQRENRRLRTINPCWV